MIGNQDFRHLIRKNYAELQARFPKMTPEMARIIATEQAVVVFTTEHLNGHSETHPQYVTPNKIQAAVTLQSLGAAAVNHGHTPASIGAAPAAHTHPSQPGFAVLSGAVKPTTRLDGTALQSGDRWWSTTDNMWFFWDGVHWKSETLHTAANLGTTAGLLPIKASGLDIYIEEYAIAGRTGLINGPLANIQITLERCSNTGDTAIATLTTAAIAANARFYLSTNPNLLLDVSALNLTSLRTVTNALLNASTMISATAQISYRWVKP